MLGWVRLLVRPPHRFVGPAGFARERTDDQRHRGARPEPVFAIAAQHGLYFFFHGCSSDFLLSTTPVERLFGHQAPGRQVPGQYPASYD
ncbi:hypothetical protein ACFC6L_09950 [Kitasatospora phosalacinea]|uniref:hypothetical protein n=1 Tax=Kitasatospora phosalacinea TaxID=2065 RepID=UPI0035D989C8